MPRNIIDDIVVKEKKKSIRDVPLPETRRKTIDAPPPEKKKRSTSSDEVKIPVHIGKPRVDDVRPAGAPPMRATEVSDGAKPPRFENLVYRDFAGRPKQSRFLSRKNIFFIVIALLFALFATLSFFAGATLTYTPKSALLSFENEKFAAQRTGESALIYSVVKLSQDKSMKLAATGESQVERKASGIIVVYNNASTEPQRLVENTRFEAANGKVYRIQSAVSVPGQKTVAGAVQPGSVEVRVYADQAGAEYNTDLTDFTLPGLKGSARFDKIYARSKTPMTGGFVGKEKTVDPKTLAESRPTLETTLRDDLVREAQAQLPAGFILFPALSSVTYEDLPQSGADGSEVTMNLRGHFYGVMFNRSDLALSLARGQVQVSTGEVVEVPDLDSLEVSFDGAAPADILESSRIDIRINGQAHLVWKIDESILRSDLLGKKKRDTQGILKNYPSIVEAEAVVRPFWKSSFPADPAEISIKKVSVQ